MSKFRKKPVTVEATQWFENGDHPGDRLMIHSDRPQGEGAVVRYYRNPNYAGDTRHCDIVDSRRPNCTEIMDGHGWIDTIEGGHTVCPGDWIITGVQGEMYPCEPSIFEATYERVEDQ